MLRSIQFPLLILLAATLAGCGETKTTSKAVAIVNLNTVAMMTGADLDMNKVVQERNKQLAAQLDQFEMDIDKQWKAKQDEFGKEPTEEQKQELGQVFQELGNRARQARAETQQNLVKFQQELATKFRELIKPISLEVAKEQGYSIVIIESPNILAFDVSINITDMVVERMKSMKAETTSGLPATNSSLGTPSATPGTGLPTPSKTIAPTNPPKSTSLKLPNLKKEDEKKETPKAVTPTPEKVKEEVKVEPKTKTPAKPESKPVTEKPAEEKPETEKPAEPAEKK
ncbi:MAG: OmpH family outer membrane protein [Planctomycetaceae bacterium]|nr:OmpH family outer membrane protein [Planctomycetaceae bacterium]